MTFHTLDEDLSLTKPYSFTFDDKEYFVKWNGLGTWKEFCYKLFDVLELTDHDKFMEYVNSEHSRVIAFEKENVENNHKINNTDICVFLMGGSNAIAGECKKALEFFPDKELMASFFKSGEEPKELPNPIEKLKAGTFITHSILGKGIIRMTDPNKEFVIVEFDKHPECLKRIEISEEELNNIILE